MSFSLANALAAFHGYIKTTFCLYLDVLYIAYLDDIIVYSITMEEHWEDVRTVLSALLQAGLYLNLQIYKFNAKKIGFVGFVITQEQD
jgi:hypothetical protein